MTKPIPAVRHRPTAPWYRHRWPWLLMLGPAIVVVAGILTAVIAVATRDELVPHDAQSRPAHVREATR